MQSVRIDKTFLFAVFVLVVIGVVFVYSSSYYQAMRRGVESTYYLVGHVQRLLFAVLFFVLGLVIPYERIKKLIFPLFLCLLGLLIVTLVIGRTQFGARRSLPLASFGLQVSEFVRVWIVFFFANFFASHPRIASTGQGVIMTILIGLFLIFLVAVQPSISVALISFLTLVAMLVYGGARWKILTGIMFAGVAVFAACILFFAHAQARVASFLSHPTYQVQQSLIAIGSGGLFGRGPGAGLQKFLFLPKIHNDFIFAHIAEEFGFVGSLVVFVFFWELFLRGVSIAQGVQDEFPRLVVYGLNATIFIIFLVHVGVSLGLLPPTGIPMPFISYGGWSLAANLYAVGLILQISKESDR
jgi:cell division protein FtsW